MSREVRIANGRYELDRDFNSDFIPAGPGWKPQSQITPDDSTRRMRPDIRYDRESREVRVTFYYNHPDTAKADINQGLRRARASEGCDRLVVWIEQEVYQELDVNIWFRRNKMERDESRGLGGMICLVREFVSKGEKNGAGNTGT